MEMWNQILQSDEGLQEYNMDSNKSCPEQKKKNLEHQVKKNSQNTHTQRTTDYTKSICKFNKSTTELGFKRQVMVDNPIIIQHWMKVSFL